MKALTRLTLSLAIGGALLLSDAARPARHELVVDLGPNRADEDVRAADLALAAGGEELDVLEVERIENWRIVLVLDRMAAETRTLRAASFDLTALAEDLASRGTVEVVLLGPEPTVALPPTRDRMQIEQSMAWLRVRETGKAEQLGVRRRFIEEFELASLIEEPDSTVAATAGQRIAKITAGLRKALEDETVAVENRRSALLRWALAERPSGPALLLLVSPGSDPPDLAFYEAALAAAGVAEAAEGVVPIAPRLSPDEVAEALAVLGWTTIAYAPQPSDGGEQAVPGGSAEENVETVVQDGQLVDRTMITQLDPRDILRRRKRRADTMTPRLLTPRAELERLTEAGGGEVAADREALRSALGGLDRRRRVQTAGASFAWEPRPVSARWAGEGGSGARAGELESSRWLSDALPRAAAEERALMLLDGDLEEGPLRSSAQFVSGSGASRLVLEVEGLTRDADGRAELPLRVTVATYEGERPRFEHVVVGSEDTAFADGVDGTRIEVPIAARPSELAPLVAIVEELGSRRWGVAFPAVTDGEGIAAGLLLPTPRAIHLLEPETSMVLGPTLFEVVYDPTVAAVEYLLDGLPVARALAPPFAARLDLGSLPEPHRVEVVAYDARGREVARDLMVVNDSGTAFRVRIVQPEPAAAAPDGRPLVGAVEVRARVEIPRGDDLDRLEFYWNEDLVATRFAEPYSQWISIPETQPKGFFRVVGFLADGTSSEDVLFVNSPGASERIRVELVQLFAVVTDAEGRPRRGLERRSFEVFEDDQAQDLATFSEAREQPLTVGLAVDSSASMFRKLPEVKKAAATFLRALDVEKDRAFVVDFGREPSLRHDVSRDLDAVEQAVRDLQAEGRTAIWKGITFALIQLQGVAGRKALIVFSDGADEDPDFAFRTCLRFARRVGVPVYVIVSNNEIYRTGGRGLNVRGFMHRLESLTRSVGGRVFLTRVGEDLESIYRDIDEELRSQYVLGYYARDLGEPRWRSLRVEVDEPGARVRTAAGHFR